MRFIVITFLGLVLLGGYFGYASFLNYTFERNVERCVEVWQTNPMFDQDGVAELCDCTLGFTKNKLIWNKDNPEFRAEYLNSFKVCTVEHTKNYNTPVCSDMKQKLEKYVGKEASIDCGCMINKIIEIGGDGYLKKEKFEIKGAHVYGILSACLEKG